MTAKKRYLEGTSEPLGYDENILGKVKVPLPTLTGKAKKNALSDENGQVIVVHHDHYSLVMDKERRQAIFTAHNIKGDCLYCIDRPGDIWRPDPKIDPRYQILGDFYKGNDWDRGHFTPCADVAYGKTREEAERAARGTFFYSNATPQHCNFNQDEWYAMENWIRGFYRTHKIWGSVQTGPVFGNYEVRDKNTGRKISQSYWKVISLIHPKTKKPTSTAFLMNQTEMWVDKNGKNSIRLWLYQVMLERIEHLTGLRFHDELEWDVIKKRPRLLTLAPSSPLGPMLRIQDVSEIMV